MTRGPARLGRGLLTDPARAVSFTFDGQRMTGHAGDTLASALLANGRQLIGRSFKYHRPRGIVTAGAEEPCALVDLITARGREPNRLATTVLLHAGLVAESQNRWPSLRFDVHAVNGLLGRFIPAGFYYKTFMSPGWAWEKVFEPLVRRAAGLGRLEARIGTHAEPAEIVHDFADVLIVGAGSAGLAAARCLSDTGLRVLLADQDAALGGGTLLDARWDSWREAAVAALAQAAHVRVLPRTTVLGAYGHGVFGALETLSPGESARFGGLTERLRVIRAKRVLLATGAIERLIAFPGNDRPGVMLAGAALAYLRRYGIAVGQRCAFFLNSDEAYEAVFALKAAGVRCVGVIDPRPQSLAAARAYTSGIPVFFNATVHGVTGAHGVRTVAFAETNGVPRTLRADALLISGGHSPATALATQLGAALAWDDALAAFTPKLDAAAGIVAGGALGVCGLAAAAQDGSRAAAAIAHSLGVAGLVSPHGDLPADAAATPLAPLWEVPHPGKAFVDLQNDVTADDVRLAQREGYEHVEHMKRYTTHSMATDQGRIGGLVGSAILAQARGVPVATVGQVKPRPYAEPTPFAALAGGEVRGHYKPTRRLPLHDWHAASGATFVATGLWLRPLVYSRDSGWDPVLKEARAVRGQVGMTDVSTLGKIELHGPDAARFLDFLYANSFSSLAVGRARYGIMLREDGMLMDDGTTSRLGPEHFLMTTTTANTTAVFEHMEFHLQSCLPELDVLMADVTDQWAQFAIAGPRARELIDAVVTGLDVSNEAFPFMAAAAATVAGIPGRLFRISFSGELAYELAVPASDALAAWQALLAAGAPLGVVPYGLDALNTLRIEKGHITGAELNGNTSAADLGFGRMLKKNGDYIGRVLAQREGMTSGTRLQLVGVRPRDPARRLRNGMHLVEAAAPQASLGYVTSSTPATLADGWLGLALLEGGHARIGGQLLGVSPMHGEQLELDIVSPHMLDPENLRVRA